MPRRGALEYFVTVVEEGQMTSAARRLGIAQPALSQAIAQLEAEVGVKLLERHPRGVTTTRAGEKLYAKARLAVSAGEAALSAARSLARAHRGAIEFGFLGAPPALDSPAEMKAFARAFPEIEIRYRELPFPSSDTASWLSSVDVAVCNSPPPHPSVWTKVLRRELRVLLVPAENPLAACEGLRAEQVLEERFVDFHRSVDPAWAGFWSLDDVRGGPPERVTGDQVVNPQEVLAALAIRSAVTVVPAAVAAVVSGLIEDVRAVPITDAAPARICLVGHLDRLNPLVGALLAFAGGDQPPSTSGRQLRPGPL